MSSSEVTVTRDVLERLTDLGGRFELHTLADSLNGNTHRFEGLTRAFDVATTHAAPAVEDIVNTISDPLTYTMANRHLASQRMSASAARTSATLQLNRQGLVGGGVPQRVPPADMLAAIRRSGEVQMALHQRAKQEYRIFQAAMADTYNLAAGFPQAQAMIADEYAKRAVPQMRALDRQVNRMAQWDGALRQTVGHLADGPITLNIEPGA